MKKASVIKGIATLAMMAVIFCMTVFPVYAAEGKVIAETVKIRASASTDSAVVGSTSKGKTIDIQEAVKDSAGTVWYKVPLAGGGHGYIRGDLVETSETIEVSAAAQQPAQAAAPPAETVPTAIGEQQAVTSANNNVRVRSGASTQHSTVASLPKGTPITLIGEANDSAGNKWYQLTCSYDGRTVEGYVRSDLITIGAAAEGGEGEGEEPGVDEGQETPEGENPEGEGDEPFEGSEPPEPEHNDYEVVYEPNQDSGEYEYYLYMNIDGTKVKISELFGAVDSARENTQKLQAQVDKEKIIIIILAVVIVLLFIVITVLLFKIRGLYYEDEEEEEEEEEEEPAPVRRKVRRRTEEEEEESVPVRKKVRRRTEEEEEESAPVRKKRPPAFDENGRQVRVQNKPGQPRTKGEREFHGAERKEPVKKAAPRKPQNFLIDDDEFEFEFLNMDDKDI